MYRKVKGFTVKMIRTHTRGLWADH